LAGHNRPNGTEGPANYIDALGGTGETGYDWIITAFEMARKHFPTTPLMINDYGIMGNPTAADSYIKIIKLLQDRGLIDAIGVQAHAFSTRGSATSMKNILNKLADTGLPIQATEMDIDGLPGSSNNASDEKQLEDIQRIFPVFWEHPSVMGVTFWGWQRGMWRDEFDAYLMRSNGEERPALQWLRAYVDTANVTYNVSNEIIEQIPVGYSLSQNYPNPFNPSTYINFTIPNNTHVRITVYDITGRVVQRLLNETKVAGNHNIYFNADALSSGVYFYEMQTDAFREVKKMSLIK
jgi:endo-1,4-beta-xylanase